jgi:hypothetical protein
LCAAAIRPRGGGVSALVRAHAESDGADPVSGRRDAEEPLERRAEVRLVRKTTFERDSRQLGVWPVQELLSSLQTQRGDILMRRLSRGCLDLFDEGRSSEARDGAEICEAQRRIEVCADIFGDTGQPGGIGLA